MSASAWRGACGVPLPLTTLGPRGGLLVRARRRAEV
jgi:hypothetical protein